MANTKRYWSGLDELQETEAFKNIQEQEFPEAKSVDEFLSDERLESTHTGRRDFLKFMGFSLTAATLAACETPVIKSIPYTNKPEDVTPGVANFYASTYYDGHDFVNVLVKTREGRPIFIKSNTKTGVGRINARVNASVMSLYDGSRIQGPQMGGADANWDAVDQLVKTGLQQPGRKVLLTNTILSPSLNRAIDVLKESAGVEHVQYDAVDYGAFHAASLADFGVSSFPSYRFDQANAVVSIGADFLGTFGDTIVYNDRWSSNRRPESGKMSRLHMFETTMSLTGSNADYRTMVKPSEQGKIATALLKAITGQGVAANLSEAAAAAVANAAKDLKKAGANGLVLAGSNDINTQRIVNAINVALGAVGTSVIHSDSGLFQGDFKAFKALVKDMNAGEVSTLIVSDCNPAYDAVNAEAFISGLANVKTSVSTSLVSDETASLCSAMAPNHHWLESWGDLLLDQERIDLVQPTIAPLFNSRATGESILTWAGIPTDWYTYMRQTHATNYESSQMYTNSDWNKAVHNGFIATNRENAEFNAYAGGDLTAAWTELNGRKGGAFELALYQKTTMGAGQHAANPILQETPDPITTVTWDNYVCRSHDDVDAMGLNGFIGQEAPASVVKVTVGGSSIELPVFPTPGQTPGTIGIALGYGRGANGENIGNAAFQSAENGSFQMDASGNMTPVGANVFPWAVGVGSHVEYAQYDITVEATGGTYPLACTQIQNTFMGRESIVKETDFTSYFAERDIKKGLASWNKRITLGVHEDVNGDGNIDALDSKPTDAFDLWHEHAVEEVGHRWGMTIDLTTCTGCSGCVTACHIENNVPVVGKDEVRRHRDMHWMRIDRFFASDYSLKKGEEEGTGVISSYRRMEDPALNPQTVHMPMMCQHCNHAPCETVCPVAATTHSNEGLNQMTYNRCIGTRYCANNCPYKVRRFNWFNYPGYKKFANFNPAQDSLMRMVLNPDVTVRSRGVMEKCSMCVQRIQSGKLDAKKNGAPVQDGSIVTACAEACPTNAISFGDLNDKKSGVRAISENNRAYHALEEIGVKPNIFYMTKVRNVEPTQA
ncbi:MAG: TAT-variant-translocated molybdopterin oxidoreductase [Flavobacteriales bacterium]|nr:TAT-variant-translocated molybdopterin oxidoreductase [Flavobacteriales bacterium]